MLRQARTLSTEETKDLTQLERIWYEGISVPEALQLDTLLCLKPALGVLSRHGGWRCFNSTLHAGRARVHQPVPHTYVHEPIAQRSKIMRKTHSDNGLFTFRVWLVPWASMGRFKNTRDHLLANLDGDRAWRYDKDSYEVNKRRKRTRDGEVTR